MNGFFNPSMRRESPRIDVEALCWELVDGKEAGGLAVDLSAMGLRLERPYTGGPTRREMQLEIEIPGIDEVMWAKAEASSDILIPAVSAAGGPMGLIRRTGYRLIAAATRDLKMIKEFVFDTDAARKGLVEEWEPEELELELGYWSARA